MYLVKNISGKAVTMPKNESQLTTMPPALGNWAIGQSDYVSEEVIGLYTPHTDVFTVVGQNGAVVPPAVVTTGLAVITGLTASDLCADGIHHQTTFTMAAMPVAVTNALAYAGLKLFDFPKGRILIEGSTGTLQWAVTSARSSTINDSASLTWSLGSAAASAEALTSTMVDQLPLATKVLSAATTALNTASTNALAASAQFDGTGTALASFLNTAFATDTDIDADGTMTVTGEITITWAFLGGF